MAVHNKSPQKNGPFVPVNCGALPDTLIESELFGYKAGAFTDAKKDKPGRFARAQNGTIFLDEIGDIPQTLQIRLLRVLEEKTFEPLGSTRPFKSNARVVVATNRELEKLVEENKFREDLYYRLNVFPIELPPLRERGNDVLLLLDHFLELNSKKIGKPPKRFSNRAVKVLMEYDWPGNVRELENLVERLFTITEGPVIHLEDNASFNIGNKEIKGLPLKEAVSIFEKKYISEVLESVDGNRTKASMKLGIHRNTLLSKTNEFGLNLNT